MKRVLVIVALLVGGCGSPRSSGKVGTDIHFPPTPSGGGGGSTGLTPIPGQTALANTGNDAGIPAAATPAQMRSLMKVPNAWAVTVEAQMRAAVPAVTQCTYMKLGPDGLGAAASANCAIGAIEGGSTRATKTTGSGVCQFGNTTFQTPATGPFTITFHAKWPTPSGSNSTHIALVTAAASAPAYISWDKATDATHFTYGNPTEHISTFVADNSLHNAGIYSDGTTLTYLIDTTSLGTLLSSGLSAAVGPGAVATFANGVDVSEIDFCFVAPTSLLIDNSGPALASTWKGFGANNMGFVETPEGAAAGMTAAMKTYEYQMDANSGARRFSTMWPIEFACTNWPTTSCTFNWASTREAAMETWAAQMNAIGIKIDPKIFWWYPDNLCATTAGGCTPTTGNLTAAATWASGLGNQLLNVDALPNVEDFRFFTEANNGNSSVIPGGFTFQSYYPHVVQTVVTQIATDDGGRVPVLPRLGISGTSDTSYPSFGIAGDTFLAYNGTNAQSTFTAWTSHSYAQQMAFAPFGQAASNNPGGGSDLTSFNDYKAIWKQWIADSGGTKPFIVDEGNNDPGADPDRVRFTGESGFQLARQMLSAAASGAAGYDPWTLRDEMAWPPSFGSAVLQYGLNPWPPTSLHPFQAGFMYSMLANLMPPGKTLRILSLSNDNYLNAAAVQSTGGDVTVVIANAGPTPLPVDWNLTSPRSDTFYGYVFNSAEPVRPTPGSPYRRITWRKTFPGSHVTDLIPGHSVAAYSTIGTYAPPARDVLLTATASSTSNGQSAPQYVNDGDASQTTGIGWQPAAGSAGTWTATLGSAQTVNHCRVTFPCTEEPFVYATGTDTTHPAVQATFTLQHDGGSDFSPAISVSSNKQCVRDFSFAPVAVTSVAYAVGIGAAAVNEIDCDNLPNGLDTVLAFYGYTDPATASGNRDYEQISASSYTIATGDQFEYDVFLADNAAAIGGVDMTISGGTCGTTELSTLSSGTWHDQNAVAGAPTADLTSRAYGTWYHRVLVFPSCAVGATVTKWEVATENTDHLCSNRAFTPPACTGGTTWGIGRTAFYDNMKVTNGGSTMRVVYGDGAPSTVANVHSTGYLNAEIRMMPKMLAMGLQSRQRRV